MNFIQLYESKRDVILFCIDCSPSMLEMRDDERYDDVQTCNLMVALEAAMQIQKKKVLVGPNDAVGIVLFNTVRTYICRHTVAFEAGRSCGHTFRRRETTTLMIARTSRRVHMCINLWLLSMHRKLWNLFSSWMVSLL